MKFSYIALLALPCLAAASVLPRAAEDYKLCCEYVYYPGDYYHGYHGYHGHHGDHGDEHHGHHGDHGDHGDYHHDHHGDHGDHGDYHHRHHRHHDDDYEQGIGYYCHHRRECRYDEESVICERYFPRRKMGIDCYPDDWEYVKAA